jgi:hypothetical protein
MKLTVIVDDKFVSVDSVGFYKFDLEQLQQSNIHAIQWDGEQGEIEYKGDTPNETITSLDSFQWVVDAWHARKYLAENPPAPSEYQLIAATTMEAAFLLTDSDWAVLPDVPLANRQEWVDYREVLRGIRSNPTTEPVWPVKPSVIWVTSE